MLKKEIEDVLSKAGKGTSVYIAHTSFTGVLTARASSVILTDEDVVVDGYFNKDIKDVVYFSVEKPPNTDVRFSLGSDPEFFFMHEGDVVPSVNILSGKSDSVKPDGVQGELNPRADKCRQFAGTYLGRAILEANEEAQKIGATLDFSVGHVLSDKAWKRTPISARRFGCSPTLNSHESKFERVSGLRERFRAAGGHIHVAYKSKDNSKLVQVMDIVAGNTCVLVDRDENNARRRVMYGRAGEYREKPYGLEYRVLSNFWLKHNVLFSLANALVRNACGIDSVGLSDELISRFDMNKVRDAINNNDKELALENFKILIEFIKEKNIDTRTGINMFNTDKYLNWFMKDDPIKELNVPDTKSIIRHWESKVAYGYEGIEVFISRQ